MSEPIVLFVDDEANILKTLTRLFLDEDYDVHTANGGQEALDLLNDGLVPTVIVSDQRMPEMGGAEFLAQAREIVPDSIRMVLTGYADINAAVDAINRSGIYRYIMKPWNDEDLKLTVKDAIDRFNLVNENKRLTQELHEKNEILSEVNKHLEEKVQERTRELQYTVNELNGRDRIQQHLVTLHPIDETLQLVVDVISEVLEPAWAAIYLVDNETSELLQKKITPEEIVINEDAVRGLFDTVVSNKEAKGDKLAGVYSSGGDHLDADVEAIPMQSTEKLYGILLVSSKNEDGFTDDEMHSLAGFCEQTTIALKDSELADNIPEIGGDLDNLLSDFT